jgi:hypothetical protein
VTDTGQTSFAVLIKNLQASASVLTSNVWTVGSKTSDTGKKAPFKANAYPARVRVIPMTPSFRVMESLNWKFSIKTPINAPAHVAAKEKAIVKPEEKYRQRETVKTKTPTSATIKPIKCLAVSGTSIFFRDVLESVIFFPYRPDHGGVFSECGG